MSVNGFLLIDKAEGMTSHDVVAKLRKKLGTKKIGHAGTLDPMATGVLVLGIGSATRLLTYVTDGRKEYHATIRLGAATHTDDREGEILHSASPSHLSDSEIRTSLNKFVGKIAQRPSSVSAIKVGGKRAHERVRDGEVVELAARDVEIYELHSDEISRVENFIDIKVRITCSAGTYIRAIARDLGAELKVGGHLTVLRRTLVSPFAISECKSWEEAQAITVAEGISRILPTRSLDFVEMKEISFGRFIAPNQVDGVCAALSPTGDFAALLENKLIADKHVAAPTLVAVKE